MIVVFLGCGFIALLFVGASILSLVEGETARKAGVER